LYLCEWISIRYVTLPISIPVAFPGFTEIL
jgi:hypothetical protein